MGEAYRVFILPLCVVIGMIAFGVSAPGNSRERAVRMTMKVLMLVPVFLIAFGLAADFVEGKMPRSADVLEALQLAVPFWAVVVTQWLVVRGFLRRRELERAA
jgi:hypothetical protein